MSDIYGLNCFLKWFHVILVETIWSVNFLRSSKKINDKKMFKNCQQMAVEGPKRRQNRKQN
jgi:hypothetical protein